MEKLNERDQMLISRLTEIILANLNNEEFGVNELVKASGLSHYTLSQRLNSLKGKTIHQFIKEIRLHKAKELLKTSDFTAAEIAYRTGFGSATYFTTCFSEFFGYSPGALRRGEITDNQGIKKPTDTGKRKSKRIVFLVSSGILIFAMALFIAYYVSPGGTKSETNAGSVKPSKSIAVLPFKNLSDSAANQYFVDGIMEDIITICTKIPDIRVISRISVEQFSEGTPVAEIAEKLKVRYIIKGSIQKSGNDFRLWVQMVDVKDGSQLWAESYNGTYTTDILDFQSSVAKKVAASMKIAITPQELKNIEARSTNDMRAYDLFMRGSELARQCSFSGDTTNMRVAVNMLREALKIDPLFLRALFTKGLAYREWLKYDSALYTFNKILELDHENSDALVGIGGVYFYMGQPDSAIKYLKRAFSNPVQQNVPWSYLAMGQVLFLLKFEIVESLPYYQRSAELGSTDWCEVNSESAEPYASLGFYSVAFNYSNKALSLRSDCYLIVPPVFYLLYQGDFSRASHFLDSVCSISICNQRCDMLKSWIYFYQKDYAGAEKLYKKALSEGQRETGFDNIMYGLILKRTGREKESLELFNRTVSSLENHMKKTGIWLSNKLNIKDMLAFMCALNGEREKAIQYLIESESEGSILFSRWKTFPGFDELLNDPEYKLIINRIDHKRDSLQKIVRQMALHGEIDL